jgi:hypothetical protein
MKQAKDFSERRTGMGLVQAMLALGVLAAVGMAGVSIFRSTDSGSLRSRTENSMMALETVLLEALRDSTNFSAADAAAVKMVMQASTPKTGADLPSVEFRFFGEPDPIGKNASVLYFTANGAPCSSFGDGQCLIEVRLSLGYVPYEVQQTQATSRKLRAAYRIRAATSQRLGAPIPALGRGSDAAPFFSSGTNTDPGDYVVSLPLDFFKEEDPACAVAGIARGWDFDKGQLTCWSFPTVACPAGQFLRGATFNSDGTISPVCQASKIVTCDGPATSDDNQVLQTMNFSTGVGTCVHIGQASVAKMPMHECPQGYKDNGNTCTANPSSRNVTGVAP